MKGKITARDKTVEMETVGSSKVQEEKHQHEEVQNTNDALSLTLTAVQQRLKDVRQGW